MSVMHHFRLDKRALLIGGVIALGLALILSQVEGFFLLSPDYFSPEVFTLINVLAVAGCWCFFYFVIRKFPLYEILAVLGLLVVSIVVETTIRVRYNPFTLPLLILFWLGIVYFILPQFFKKYKVAILSVYGGVISYFLVYRLMPNYEEDYHQNFLNFLIIPLPVFAALWGYEQWRWLSTLKADKAKAELTLLKNQINPHFFFNTLNNLYGLAVEKSEQAPAMILKLSEMMRYTIYEGKADYVALEDEVKYLQDYIQLHQIRYRKEADITVQTDLQHPHKIAPLMLIVPLENAFKHGLKV